MGGVISTTFFVLTRLTQLVTLIPVIGMLAYFVNLYTANNALTPPYILTLFIVSVIGSVWAVASLFRLSATRHSALFSSFVDLLIFGAFIAGVVELRAVTQASSCSSFIFGYDELINGVGQGIYFAPFGTDPSKTCNMLKASFAFGIMNVIFWAWSALMILLMRKEPVYREEVVYSERRRSSRGHESRRGGSRSGSARASSRRSQSRRREAYV